MHIKYKTVIIGAGNIASKFDAPNSRKILTHAHAIMSNDKLQLLGFYDVNTEQARLEAIKWGVNSFESIENAIEKADIVCCCAPDIFHHDILMNLAHENIKLIITEKPLATSVDEVNEICDVYNKTKIPIALNYSRRYIREFRNIRDDYMTGEYGELLKGVGYYGKGATHNGGHMIDLLSFIFKHEPNVSAVKNGVVDFCESDKTYDITFAVDNGIFNMIGIDSRICTIFELDMLFEKARIRIIDGGTSIEKYVVRESADYKDYYNYVLKDKISVDYSTALSGLYDNILEHLEGREKLLCSIDEGARVIKLCSQIQGELNV